MKNASARAVFGTAPCRDASAYILPTFPRTAAPAKTTLRSVSRRPSTPAMTIQTMASPRATADEGKRPPLTYSVAPMMDVTDRHFRALSRLISKKCVLYTEMVVDRTLIYNEKLREYELRLPKLQGVADNQHPVVLQLGGSVPEELEAAARIAAPYGYDEINLNCGCPSPKVAGKGCFGAALMKTPEVVAEATRRMASVLPNTVPVTVKCRLGVDDEESYEGLHNFVSIVHERGGVNHFIIHARKAILGGLSPAQNRSIPPLKYHYVHRLLKDFPHLTFSINGGFKTLSQIDEQLKLGVHGVMVGRAVMDKPWHALCDVDNVIYEEPSHDASGKPITRRAVLKEYVAYAEQEMADTGCSVRAVIKPLLNLFHGEPHGKKYRRVIDECLRDTKLTAGDIIDRACLVLSSEVLDAPPPSMKATEPSAVEDVFHGPVANRSHGALPGLVTHEMHSEDWFGAQNSTRPVEVKAASAD